MYKVVFEFINEATGWAWVEDFLDNNGQGYTVVDANMIAADFNSRDNTRNARIVKMEDNAMTYIRGRGNGRRLATIKMKEHKVKYVRDFTDKELMTLKDLYRLGYVGRFTAGALEAERKRRGLD